jgi:N-sulfoglucosamine sulfohydrolase
MKIHYLRKKAGLLMLVFAATVTAVVLAHATPAKSPNVIVLMMDDQSWLHTGYNGDPIVRMPNIDRLANGGLIFDHAYTSASSCAPARAAMFTGRNFWELGPAANLHGMLCREFIVFPEILREHGYQYGYTGKGYGPATRLEGVQTFDPAGGGSVNFPRFTNEEMPFPGMNPMIGHNFNYSGAFEKFLSERDESKPFVFYTGFIEPHLPYHNGSGEAMGLDPTKVQVPPYMVDNEWTRRFFLDYYFEIKYADQHIGSMIESLEKRGLLENTLILWTSDNGMPAPRCKGTCYDWGVRMPFVAYWQGTLHPGRRVTDFISLVDIGPTILELAGIEIPQEMTGRSFVQTLKAESDGRVDHSRDHVFFGKERHNPDEFFPMRAIRTDDFLYIHNFNPDVPRRWTYSKPPQVIARDHPTFEKYASDYPAQYLIRARDKPEVSRLFDLAYGPQPSEELYDVKNDEFQLNNLADDPRYAAVKAELKAKLFAYLTKTGDPRMGEDPDIFDRYFEKYAPPGIE